MPRQRRDRETAQEEQETTEQQEVGTPQNKAKAGTPRRAKSASNKDSAVAVVASTAVENNNPLKKVVFVHYVLRFLRQGYLDSDDKKKVVAIPKFLELRHVSSSWKETVEFYNPQPQPNVITFRRHFSKLVEHDKKFNSPSVQGSIALRDIVGWLSNIEIDSNIYDDYFYCYYFNSNSRDKSDSDDDDTSVVVVGCILSYFRRCLESSAWKEQSGFEHHAAFVRDTLLWVSEFCVFKYDYWSDDDVEAWCSIVDDVITMKEGEYFDFDTPEMRDMLLSVSSNVAIDNGLGRADAVTKWFKLVDDLTRNNEKAQKIFGTKEVYDEFIRLSKFKELRLFDDDRSDEPKVKAEYCLEMLDALSAITQSKQNQDIFATVELRDTIARISKWVYIHCYGYGGLIYLSKLLHNLISTNKSNKKLFAVESIRDVMLRNYEEDECLSQRYEVNSYDLFYFRHHRWGQDISSNEGACLFFENLVTLSEVNPKLFLIDATRKNFVDFARRLVENGFRFGKWRSDASVSSATISSYLTALKTMLNHNEKLFFSQRIDEFLIKLKAERKLIEELTSLFSEIENIYEKMKKQLEKEKQKKEQEKQREMEEAEEEENRYYEEKYGKEKAKKMKEEREKEKQQEETKKEKFDQCDYYELDDDYWVEGEYMYWSCYWREHLEEKRSKNNSAWW